MKLFVRLFVLVVFILGGSSCQALVAIPTNELSVPDVSPLVVTGYRANLSPATTDPKSGKVLTQRLEDVDVLELYNNGDVPLDLSQWHIYDATGAAIPSNDNVTPRELMFHSDKSGYLLPGKYVVVAKPLVVEGATYEISGWSQSVTSDRAVPALLLVNDKYRVGQVDIKVSNTLQKRTHGVDGYLTSFAEAIAAGTQNVDAIATEQLFDDGLYLAPSEPIGLRIVEIYPFASDCNPFRDEILCGDYVKLLNDSNVPIQLDDYALRTDSGSSRSLSNTFSLIKPDNDANVLEPGEYLTVHATDDGDRMSLTNSGGYVWLEDVLGLVAFENTVTSYPSAGSSQQGYSYAEASIGSWQWTKTPIPGGANVITPIVVECPEGKYLSPETGRCRTLEEALSVLASCDEGYERNPLTNRCRKIMIRTAATLAPCGEGQERNPVTNRCRSIASAVAELLPCDEGYERNPETNRCRKLRTSNMPLVGYPVQPLEKTVGISPIWWGVGGIGALAVGYAVWEWRREISTGLRRVIGFIGHRVK